MAEPAWFVNHILGKNQIKDHWVKLIRFVNHTSEGFICEVSDSQHFINALFTKSSIDDFESRSNLTMKNLQRASVLCKSFEFKNPKPCDFYLLLYIYEFDSPGGVTGSCNADNMHHLLTNEGVFAWSRRNCQNIAREKFMKTSAECLWDVDIVPSTDQEMQLKSLQGWAKPSTENLDDSWQATPSYWMLESQQQCTEESQQLSPPRKKVARSPDAWKREAWMQASQLPSSQVNKTKTLHHGKSSISSVDNKNPESVLADLSDGGSSCIETKHAKKSIHSVVESMKKNYSTEPVIKLSSCNKENINTSLRAKVLSCKAKQNFIDHSYANQIDLSSCTATTDSLQKENTTVASVLSQVKIVTETKVVSSPSSLVETLNSIQIDKKATGESSSELTHIKNTSCEQFTSKYFNSDSIIQTLQQQENIQSCDVIRNDVITNDDDIDKGCRHNSVKCCFWCFIEHNTALPEALWPSNNPGVVCTCEK
ncbi:uncharacterized protein LOC130614863 isoform X2 [Hydractinia symbiolongicarpus]|uniref:uncharacterized protein LOC130614863 isoform X2 n=1 Tax=Hydractinia symbiolongicarpus TaxID=13093 RepID=UPI0025509A67|nr:uncharacterized protein LOC130614863 isoform X2 [Hydractinia symbiolongicarpus]